MHVRRRDIYDAGTFTQGQTIVYAIGVFGALTAFILAPLVGQAFNGRRSNRDRDFHHAAQDVSLPRSSPGDVQGTVKLRFYDFPTSNSVLLPELNSIPADVDQGLRFPRGGSSGLDRQNNR